MQLCWFCLLHVSVDLSGSVVMLLVCVVWFGKDVWWCVRVVFLIGGELRYMSLSALIMIVTRCC